MKKVSVVMIALSLVVSMFGVANAGYKNGMGGGRGGCMQMSGASSDQFRKFQADTIDLRQEMMTKRFAMQRENLNATPDSTKVSALQAEISAIQAKIQDVRLKSGLPVGKKDGECGQRMGGAGKKGMGRCSNGPCFQK